MSSLRSLSPFALAVAIALSGCFSALNQKGKKTGAEDTTPPANTSSAISSSSTETQVLSGQGDTQGAAVAFPPGSLAVDTTVTLSAGGDLSADALTELGLETGVAATGTAVIVDSDTISDPVGTLAVTIPAPASAGLNLQSSRLVVIYRVVIKATGEYRTGIIPQSAFSSSDQAAGTVTIGTDYFGQFQTAYIDAEVETKTEVKSASGGFKDSAGMIVKGVAAPDEGDKVAPTVVLTTNATSPTSAAPVPFTATFSEPVTGMTAGAIAKSSGQISGFKQVGNAFKFIVIGAGSGKLTVSIQASAAKDAAGNQSAASNPVSLVVDTGIPTVTFSNTAGQVVPFANLTAFTVTGTCSEAQKSITLTVGSNDSTTTCQTNGTFSASLNLSSRPAGLNTIRATIHDASGNKGEGQVALRVPETPTVTAELSSAPKWLDHASPANVPCSGMEGGAEDAVYAGEGALCVDGGPRRKFVITTFNSCNGLAAVDDLGAFNWRCVDEGTTISFRSSLRPAKTLSDLIEPSGTAFKPNQVFVQNLQSAVVARSTADIWWSANSFDVVGTDDANPMSISAPGTIYTVVANITRPLINFTADNTALVVMPGAKVSMTEDPVSFNCPSEWPLIADDPSPTAVCLVSVLERKFVRIEGLFDNDSTDRSADVGLLVKESKFVNLSRIDLQRFGGSDQNLGRGLLLRTTNGVTIDDLRIKDTHGIGLHSQFANNTNAHDIYIANSSSEGISSLSDKYGTIARAAITNNGLSGINIEEGTTFVLSQILSASNDDFGINLYYNDNVVVQNATLSLNGTSGLHTNSGNNTVLNDILSFNNSIGFNAADSMRDNNLVQARSLVDVLSPFSFMFDSVYFTNSTYSGPLVQQDAGSSACDVAGFTTPPVCTAPALDLEDNFGGILVSETLATLDFLDGADPWKSWGIGTDPASMSSALNIGRCTSANCQLYDWRVTTGVNEVQFVHGTHTPNSACPINGTDKYSFNSGDVLLSSIELHDGLGDDDALCEQGEVCVFAPHVGGYQGHGNFTGSCTYSASGGIDNVKLIGYQNASR